MVLANAITVSLCSCTLTPFSRLSHPVDPRPDCRLTPLVVRNVRFPFTQDGLWNSAKHYHRKLWLLWLSFFWWLWVSRNWIRPLQCFGNPRKQHNNGLHRSLIRLAHRVCLFPFGSVNPSVRPEYDVASEINWILDGKTQKTQIPIHRS
jgi:hypothetical protein